MERKKRDLSVELLRIIAALQVVGTHVNMEPVIDGKLGKTRLLMTCLVGDGVAIFWMILGFFYFNSTDGRKRLRRLLTRIVIPMFAFFAFTFYFHDYIMGSAPKILQSVTHAPGDYRALITGSLLRYRSILPGTSHFWYLWVYILMILVWPALKPARDALTGDAGRDRRLLAIIFGLMVFNDLSFNGFLEIGHFATRGMVGATLWVLIGDIVYRNRAVFDGNLRRGLVGLAAFLAAMALRYAVLRRVLPPPRSEEEPLYWYTSYACVCVLGQTAFVFGIAPALEKRRALSAVIAHLGRMTFGVYIWHKLVIEKLAILGLPQRLVARFGNDGGGVFLYQACSVFIVFAISLAISEALSLLWRLILRASRRIAARRD